ncbi:unnamed protein product [marine sediment metagenome]|uniref:Endonuclease GajA/Old nuclease/RecF-like AAA domain-containing protein n=1 Tax=marine sediment metagenome TaxID=412755 RepID=X1RJ44_9ZZZZ
MKLKQIEIDKFRSIDHISIVINELAVLIGENNAGKTNILKALASSFNSLNKFILVFIGKTHPVPNPYLFK